MKRLLFLALSLVLLANTASQAQTSEGDMILGGGIANINIGLDNDFISIGLNPDAGYFVIDNLALGGSLPITFASTPNYTTTSIGAGLFGRYYMPMDKISPFAGASLGYRIYTNSYTFTDWNGQQMTTTNTAANAYANLNVGAAYFLNKSIGLHGVLNSGDILNPGTTLSLSLGLYIYFQPKKKNEETNN